MVEKAKAQRILDTPLEVIRFGRTADAKDTAMVSACAEAGASWWMESTFPRITDINAIHRRIHQGPPSVEQRR
jgi:hypothetical protein